LTEITVSLLFSFELDNGHYDALLPVEKDRSGISGKVLYGQPLLKTFPLDRRIT
jgi:hypothetical protein